MSDAPQIVKDRLRAAAPREAHPDADVLTAFAEQALSGNEREDVVRHLSRCADCREVVALSIPPSLEPAVRPQAAREPTPARQPVARAWSWLAWPNLRWAALAASVVVVGSVLFLHSDKPTDSTLGTEKAGAQGNLQTPAIGADAKAVSPFQSDALESKAATPPARAEQAVPSKQRTRARDDQPPQRTYTRATTPPPFLAGNKRLDSPRDKNNFSLDAGKLALPHSAPSGIVATGGVLAADQTRGSSNGAAVSTAANEALAAPEQSDIIAKNDAPVLPVKKAKPAARGETAKEESELQSQVLERSPKKNLAEAYAVTDSLASEQKQLMKQSAAAAIPHWLLAQGKLQRSLDAGQTWQSIPQLGRPVLTFGVLDSEVWAGSQGGTLFHSTDAGATWTALQPASKNATLTADIVTIMIRSHAQVVLTAGNGESWTTTDAGKTWDKK